MNKSLEFVETTFGNFLIDEQDLIGRFIQQNKFWESHLYELYSKMITPDYHCVDAGANIGFHSIQFGKLGKKVYSFEPQRYVFNQMSANILINDLDNQINTYRLGLGDKEETQQLWNIEHEDWVGGGMHNWGGRGIVQKEAPSLYPGWGGDRHLENEFREEDTVQVISLDSLNLSQCDLIKIDVQGYEYNLIVGAKNTLNKFKPVIFLENAIGDEADAKTSLLVKEYLLNMGYNFYRYNIGNKEDCILIHSEHKHYEDHVKIISDYQIKYNIIKEA